MAKIDEVYENKCNLAQSSLMRGLVTPSTPENSIVWTEEGLKATIEALQAEVYDLRYIITEIQNRGLRQDIIPAPDVDASTFYETASDGTLRAGVDVVVEGDGLVEVAMLEDPTIEYASADATVDEANPTTPYDTTMRAGLDASGNESRALLAFSWGTYNPGTSITGLWAASPILALVRLHKNGTEDDALDLQIFPMDKDASWSESTVTWNSKPDNEETALDLRANNTDADYSYFDITPYIRRAREMRDGSWTGSPPGFTILALGPDLVNGNNVTWDYRGSGTNDYKPQLWIWERAYKSQILGSATKEAKFYGQAGGTYYITYRYIDANNNPGAWAIPVKVTLPSEGATPSAPSISASRLKFDALVLLKVTYASPPADFSHYEIQEAYDSGTATGVVIKTRNDRFVFQSPTSAYQNLKYRVRAVTRSGKTSSYSSYSQVSSISQGTVGGPASSKLMLQTTDALMEVGSGGYLKVRQTSTGTAYRVLRDVNKDLDPDNITAKVASANSDSTGTTTSKAYVDRHSISLTPPGSGTALVLLVAKATMYKNTGSDIKITFKVDGSTTNDEEAYSADAQAETASIMRVVQVSAGSSHTFKLCYKSGDGGTVAIYRSCIYAIDLGRL